MGLAGPGGQGPGGTASGGQSPSERAAGAGRAVWPWECGCEGRALRTEGAPRSSRKGKEAAARGAGPAGTRTGGLRLLDSGQEEIHALQLVAGERSRRSRGRGVHRVRVRWNMTQMMKLKGESLGRGRQTWGIRQGSPSSKQRVSPGWCGPGVRASACGPKGLGLNSPSRARRSVAGLIPGPQCGACGRQPIAVSLSYECLSLSLLPPFHSL